MWTDISVPFSLQYPTTNLYKSVVGLIFLRRLVEEALYSKQSFAKKKKKENKISIIFCRHA